MTPQEALEFCLMEIEAGRKTVAECAGLFPNLPDLEAQLRAAQAVQAWQTPTLAPAASRRLEAQLRGQRRARLSASPVTPPRLTVLRWFMAAVGAVVFMAVGAATVAASGSLPGDLLYPVKRAAEAAQLAITAPAERAALYALFAERRLDEVAALGQRPDVDPATLTSLLDELSKQTEAALTSVGEAPADRREDLLSAILEETDRQQAVLQAIQAAAPPQAQSGLAAALQASGHAETLAAERLEALQPVGSATPLPTAPAPTATPDVPGQTHVPFGQTQIPPGQTQAVPLQTHIPPGQTRIPPGQTRIPPGQQGSQPPATDEQYSVEAPPASSLHASNCASSNPQSPNYCTPTAQASSILTPPSTTPCATHPGSKPNCQP